LGRTRGWRRPRLSLASSASGRWPSKFDRPAYSFASRPGSRVIINPCLFTCAERPRRCRRAAWTPQARKHLGARCRRCQW
jgi:hypothetical protein